MQGTIQHGLNNTFTLYGGVTAFDDYQAYLVGTGVNTGFANCCRFNSVENGIQI